MIHSSRNSNFVWYSPSAALSMVSNSQTDSSPVGLKTPDPCRSQISQSPQSPAALDHTSPTSLSSLKYQTLPFPQPPDTAAPTLSSLDSHSFKTL